VAGATGPRQEGGRRLAAVWFCDIVESTGIAGELGDRRFRQIVTQFLATVRSALRRNGGREIDTAGDGMFAVFETPAGALGAALESAAAVRTLGLEIRSGVHVGEVEHDPDGRVGGITVIVGARIMSLASAGEVFTTRITSELAGGAGFLFEDRGTHELKGIPGRHAIVALLGSEGAPLDPPLGAGEARRRRAAASDAPDRHTAHHHEERARPFVGRTRELDELLGALADAVAGRGSLSLICGEPGIGKTRLITTVAERAEARGWAVLVGRCWEGGGAPAYWPWIQVVREAGGDFSQLASTDATAATAGRSPRDAVSDPADPETARFQLFDGVGRYLADVARERPCLTVLEDLHAADGSSLLLLRFVASSVREHPIVILGSYRENDPRMRDLADLFGNLARLGRRIPLGGLSSEEVASYIALASGDLPSEALAERVGDVTGGNPFFVGEIVRELEARAQLTAVESQAALPVPEGIRTLIRRRVADLSLVTTDLLRIAAVIGRDLDPRVISSATTLSVSQTIDALGEAERAGVIVEGRGTPGTYTFAHDLLRETLYGDLPAAKRMDLHRIVAGVLEGLYRDGLESHLAEIAHHLTLAAPLGEAERAVEFSIRAGDGSLEVFAYEDAARLYERAVRLLGPAAPPSEHTARIHLKLGDALSRAGNPEAARRSFEQAATIARHVRAIETFALAALGYGAAEKVRAAYGGLALTVRFRSPRPGSRSSRRRWHRCRRRMARSAPAPWRCWRRSSTGKRPHPAGPDTRPSSGIDTSRSVERPSRWPSGWPIPTSWSRRSTPGTGSRSPRTP
jgi:class 3 adenylate cyclase